MHYRDFGQHGKIAVTEDSEDPNTEEANYVNKLISEFLLLIVGTAGSGKSVTVENIVYILWKLGWKIIYITEKKGDAFAPCFSMFKAMKPEHLKILKDMQREPGTIPNEVLMPFTFNFPFKKKHPQNFKFFTFDIKSLKEDSLTIVLPSDQKEDALTVRLCSNLINKGIINNEDNIWSFVRKLSEKVKHQSNYLDPENMYLRGKMSGDEKTVDKIVDSITNFKKDFFMQPSNFKLDYKLGDETRTIQNINFLDLINNQGVISILNKSFIRDNRHKYLIDNLFFRGIDDALADSKKVKYPVLIVIEEVKALLPNSNQVSYEKKLSRTIIDLLSTIRSKGKGCNTLLTTQSYFQTSSELRAATTNTLFFKLNMEDLRQMRRNNMAREETINLLGTLKKGQFILQEELLKDKIHR